MLTSMPSRPTGRAHPQEELRAPLSRAGRSRAERAGQAGPDLHTSALDKIGRRIISGYYPAGSPLDLDALGKDAQVGRSVIREALRVLGAMGLIRAWPKRGTFVEPRSRWDWLDPSVLRWYYETDENGGLFDAIAEMREVIEPGVARLAAERRTEAQLDALRRCLDKMAASDLGGDDFTEADVSFHRLVLECTQNELLSQYANATEVALRVQNPVTRTGGDMSETLARHRALYDAIVRRSPRDAEASVRHVLEQTRLDWDRARAAAPTELYRGTPRQTKK